MNLLPARRRGFGDWVPDRLKTSFDGIWDDFFGEFENAFGNLYYETEDGDIVYEIEAPGFNKDNVKIQISDGVMDIKGMREFSKGEKHVGQTSLQKRISVGDVDNADAFIKDGIIKVVIKYKKEDVKEVKVLDVKNE